MKVGGHVYPTEGPYRKAMRFLEKEEQGRIVDHLRKLVSAGDGDMEGALTIMLASRLQNVEPGMQAISDESLKALLASALGEGEVFAYEAQNVGFGGMFGAPASLWIHHLREFRFDSSDDWVIFNPSTNGAVIVWHWGGLMMGELGGG